MGRRRINQTRIKTSTGIWTADYNAQNRPVRFTRENADCDAPAGHPKRRHVVRLRLGLDEKRLRSFRPSGLYPHNLRLPPPYGTVTEEVDVTQPIQWSSEYADPELGLVYYNYRYYNTVDGRWNQRDFYMDVSYNLYAYLKKQSTKDIDFIGFAGGNSFRYHVTEREEIFGHTFASGSLDELAKQASKISNKNI